MSTATTFHPGGPNPSIQVAAATRLITIAESFDLHVDDLQMVGWEPLTDSRKGHGGQQMLLRQGPG